ncbi:Hypothetical protein I596_298 [Dokdonella koreensis DS-123]|uniref:Uncharacterized protein n=1 Tax=Dokdonella koreensis DS-123 TaxID=1300342 RepID=A0A167GAE1_9GAMM|nr:Hypothetical protein I596_298 [Dokdonella koreensis DS-123]
MGARGDHRVGRHEGALGTHAARGGQPGAGACKAGCGPTLHQCHLRISSIVAVPRRQSRGSPPTMDVQTAAGMPVA